MRTEMGKVQQAKNGKWNVSFLTYKGTPGNERVISHITSGDVFDTEDAAYAGGNRALDLLEKTGTFPNMTEVF